MGMALKGGIPRGDETMINIGRYRCSVAGKTSETVKGGLHVAIKLGEYWAICLATKKLSN